MKRQGNTMLGKGTLDSDEEGSLDVMMKNPSHRHKIQAHNNDDFKPPPLDFEGIRNNEMSPPGIR